MLYQETNATRFLQACNQQVQFFRILPLTSGNTRPHNSAKIIYTLDDFPFKQDLAALDFPRGQAGQQKLKNTGAIHGS